MASIALFVSLIEREWVSAIFINLMIASARVFIDYVKIKSHSAINSLMELKPEKVKILEEGRAIEVPIEKVKKGDRVIVNLGERVPVDGLIEEGEAMIDQSSLTGESAPVFKKKGDMVLSFTTISSGNLIIRTEKVGQETTFEKIIGLVEQSQKNKAPIYASIDRFANWYIVLTVLGSSIVYFFSRDVHLVLGLLLVSCADDIAIATPLALMSAITHSAKHGAIIKGGDYLEAMAKVEMIIFDKTGTLTKGKLTIEEIFSFNNRKKEEVLSLAAIASSGSNHPISQTVFRYAKEKNIFISEPEKLEECGGKGIIALSKGKKIIIGKLLFFQENNIRMSEEQASEIKKEISKGLNVTLVGCNGDLIGFLTLTDEIKPKVKETIKEFKRLGVKKIIMLTGDNEKIAQKVSSEIGIDEFHANLLPADKLEYLRKCLSKKDKTSSSKVAMVGDGVNDAPVLAMADVGIAMGAIGSDSAIEAADIALMKDDLSQIPDLIKIGRATMKVISQNLLMWGLLNIFGLALVFSHILNPSGAATYNFITDFIPIINSLRLFR
ncbi:MAG: cation-translocating P-type ATPase [Candidatus Nealsonbacteria bacterium]|nr:cation-translocating P-type ATPase [Candidatus Nealsonbacteria bacterium]